MSAVVLVESVCPWCDGPSAVEVDAVAYERWRSGVLYVQQAFPDLPAPQREILISGTHPACWVKFAGSPDD